MRKRASPVPTGGGRQSVRSDKGPTASALHSGLAALRNRDSAYKHELSMPRCIALYKLSTTATRSIADSFLGKHNPTARLPKSAVGPRTGAALCSSARKARSSPYPFMLHNCRLYDAAETPERQYAGRRAGQSAPPGWQARRSEVRVPAPLLLRRAICDITLTIAPRRCAIESLCPGRALGRGLPALTDFWGSFSPSFWHRF